VHVPTGWPCQDQNGHYGGDDTRQQQYVTLREGRPIGHPNAHQHAEEDQAQQAGRMRKRSDWRTMVCSRGDGFAEVT